MEINLKNKRIAVIGASSFIGRKLVEKLISNGATVIGTYYRNERDDFSCYKDEFTQIKCDVTNHSDIENLVGYINRKRYRMDVVINCVGIIKDEELIMMDKDDWNKVVEVNLTGSFYVLQAFAQLMRKQRFGKIICVSSVIGLQGREKQANYAVSKAGMNIMSRTAAMELAQYGISVNVVCPGFISTDLNKSNEKKIFNAINDSFMPLDKNIEVFTNFVTFMTSDLFENVTGQNFVIDSRIQMTV